MTQYRKKPLTIEAVQIKEGEGGRPHIAEGTEWLAQAILDDRVYRATDDAAALMVETDEGVMRAHIGDYIIRGVEGEIYPCRKSVFESTYEPVPQAPPQIVREGAVPDRGVLPPWQQPIRSGQPPFTLFNHNGEQVV